MIRRVSIFLGIAIPALLLIFLLLLAWVVGSASGTGVAWGAVGNLVPGLTMGSLEGRLAGPLNIRQLHYADEYRDLAIDSIELDWSPSKLLGLAFTLEKLRVSGVSFTQLKAAPVESDKTKFSLPESIALPVDLVFKDIAVRDIAFRSTPEAEPLRIDQIEISSSFLDQQLLVDELSVQGPIFSIRATSDVTTRDNFDQETEIQWTAQPPELADAAGKLIVSGGLSELKVEHRIDAPYSLEQFATLTNVVDRLNFELETRIIKLRLSDIGEALPDLALSGDLQAQGDAGDIRFDTNLLAESPGLGQFSLRAYGEYADYVLVVSQFLLSDDNALRLAFDGEVDLSGDVVQLDLQSQWRELRWPLLGGPRIIADKGAADLRGTMADYVLRGDSQLRVPGQTSGSLELQGRGNEESFDLSRVHIALLGGSLDGSGKLRWTPSLEGSIELQGSGIDPAVLAPELPGDLELELRVSGGSRDSAAFAQIDTVALSGTLRELPVGLQLSGQLDSGRFDLHNFRLASGDTVVTADGQVGENIDLDWRLKSANLADLAPQATGSISGEGHVGGTAQSPTLRATMQGTGLGYTQYSLKTLALEADIDVERPAPSMLRLALGQGAAGDITLQTLELIGDGTSASHTLNLAATTSLGSVELGVAGELQDTAWHAQLDKGLVQYPALAPWTLTSPHAIHVTSEKQTVGKGCWASDEAELCLQGGRGSQAVSAEVDLQSFALAYLRPLLPAIYALEGLVSARLSLVQQEGQEAELDGQLSAAEVTLHRRTGEAQSKEPELLLALEPSRLNVALNQTGLRADLSAPFKNTGGVKGQLDIEAGETALGERPLHGQIDISVPDIEWLTAFSPELDQAAGALSAQLELDGSINEPQTQGKLELSEGSLQLVTPGLEISKISFDAWTTAPQALEFSGQAESGKGALTVSGAARLSPEGTEADISISGDAFQIVDNADARVFMSPDLTVAIRENGTRVTGDVVIPQAAITPRKLPPSAVSVSSDQVIVAGGSTIAPAANVGVEAKVRVSLGDDVTVDGFGFTGRLSGGLLVEQAPNRPTLGTGELNIEDGEYRAYGQGLVIEEGDILFVGGPIEQPGIKVRAVRRPANNILVGVRVRGPVQEPEFNLFSEPAMSQTETLSWLVLGRPLAGSSEGQEDMLAQAATMLGIKGGNYLADRFGDNLGVDSIGFETGSGEAGAASDVSQAALVVGKYLSPDLFVSYGIGLFDSISTIKLDYSLSESWSVSTQSSTEASGGDVNYVIER